MNWVTRVFRRRRLEAQVDAELRDHLDRQIADNLKVGLPPAEARRRAYVAIGGFTQVSEQVRDVWYARGLRDMLRDLAFGVRQARRAPGYAALVIVTLALAVGANLAVFSIVNAIWLRPRPVADPDRVVVISNLPVRGERMIDSLNERQIELVRTVNVFDGLAAQAGSAGLMGDWRPRLIFDEVGAYAETLPVTEDYFEVLGVPVNGRTFEPSDFQPGASAVAVISHHLWHSHFDGRPELIGQTLETSHVPVTIAGIAPEGFHGARLGERYDVWLPVGQVGRVSGVAGLPFESELVSRFLPHLLLARLQPGVTLGDSRRALERVTETSKLRVAVHPLADVYGTQAQSSLLVGDEAILRVVWMTGSLVLLAGCATLAVLVLVHYERRRPELAVRLALGCARTRLVRQLFTELGGLVIMGTLLSVAVATWSLGSATSLSLPSGLDLGRLDLGIDWRGFVAAAVASLATMVLAGMVPLARFTTPALASGLTTGAAIGSAASIRFRGVMLVVHVAATAVVLVAAGLFVRTVVHGFVNAPGFDVNRTISLALQPSMGEFHDPSEDDSQPGLRDRELAAYARLVAELRAIPGVGVVTFGGLPMFPEQMEPMRPLTIGLANGERELHAGIRFVGPEWMDALGLELLAGRRFDQPPDGTDTTPVLVSASVAAGLWPGRSPLGQRFTGPGVPFRPKPTYEVVGVIPDVHAGSLRFPPRGTILAPGRFEGFAATSGSASTVLTLRTHVDAARLTPAVRATTAKIFPRAARIEVDTGADLVAEDFGRQRLGAWFFSGFGLVSLCLGLAGVFGLVAYLAEARRREIGIRMALGATPERLMRSLAGHGLTSVLAGTAVGLGAALVLSRAVAGFIHGIGLFDPVTYAGVALLMIGGATAAGLLAALRISRISPMDALRAE